MKKKLGLVYGCARVGLMGILADAALAYVNGVIPSLIAEMEVTHSGLSELHLVSECTSAKK
jgi:predicted Rossmann-fold nucleotide-binding protein